MKYTKFTGTCEPNKWYKVGRHTLFCGDTTSPQFIEECRGSKLAFADPPYGSKVDKWDNEFYWNHDYLTDVADIVCVTPGPRNLATFFKLTKMSYRWELSAHISNGRSVGDIGYANWTHIPIFANKNVKIWRQMPDTKRITLIRSESDDTLHKGRKPTELMKWIIELFTEPHDIIVDPFAGSGTTLIVCERLNRTCITGEIDPEYCEEIIKRWNHEPMSKVKRLENFI